MRIIAGRFKRFRIPSPRKGNVRPTTDRLREALFSILGSAVEGAEVLDLFAGTGAFGFEALSRGASSVAFVDHDKEIVRNLRATAKALGIEDQVHVISLPAVKAMRQLRQAGKKFRIIFVDPPYETQTVPRLLAAGSELPYLLGSDGLLIIEMEAGATECAPPPALTKSLSRKYGATRIEIFMNRDEVS